MVLGRTVEGRRDHLALGGAFKVGDLRGSFVHQHHHQLHLGIVDRDGIGNGLHYQGLAGLGRGHDERALTLTDGGDKIDDPASHLVGGCLQLESLLRVQRGELREVRALADPVNFSTVDGIDPHHRIELLLALPLARRTDHTGDQVALTQAEFLDHGEGDVRVVRTWQVAVGTDEGVIVENVQDAASRDEHIVFGNHRLVVAFQTAATTAVTPVLAIPAAAPATTAAAAFLFPVAALVVSILVVSILIVALVLAGLTLIAASAIPSVVLPVLAISVPTLALTSASLGRL